MKKRYHLWWIFSFLSIIVTLINPYVGEFVLFNVIEFLFIITCYFIFCVNSKLLLEYEENSSIKQGKKNYSFRIADTENRGIKIAVLMMSIVMSLLTTAMGASLISMNNGKKMSPFDLGGDDLKVSWICYLITLILTIFKVYYCIKFFWNKKYEKKEKKKKKPEVEIDIYHVKEVVVVPLSLKCWLLLLFSIGIGFLNPYYNFMALLNLWYPFTYFIFYVNLKSGQKMIPKLKDEFLKYNAVKQLYLFLSNKTKGWLIFAYVCFEVVFNLIKIIQTKLYCSPLKMLLDINLIEQNTWVLLWISVIVDICLGIVFGMQVYKNKFKE